jgi:hypothetical protein
MKLIPATAELWTAFYGKPPTRSMRAWVGMVGEDVVGVVGMYHDTNRMVLFCDMKPEARAYKRVIVKTALFMESTIRTLGLPVVATADCAIAGSERLLRRIGFEETSQGVFAYERV